MDSNEDLYHLFIIYFINESKKYYIRAYKEKEKESFPIVLIKLDLKLVIKCNKSAN